MKRPPVMQEMGHDDAATFAVGLVAREAVMLDGQLSRVHQIVRARTPGMRASRPKFFRPAWEKAYERIAQGELLGDDTALGVKIMDDALIHYNERSRYIHDRLLVSHDGNIVRRDLITAGYTDTDIDHLLETYAKLVGSTWQLVALCALLTGDEDDEWRMIAEGNFIAIYGGAVSYPA